MTPIIAFKTRENLMQATADAMSDTIESALRSRGSACIALSGGSTPEPAYRLLAAKALDWKNVTLALVDERFVPPSDPASNEGMLRRAFAPALAQAAQLVPMYAAGDVAEAAALADAAYAALRFDIALMGMGADGHTASWFPGAPDLSEALNLASPRSVMALSAPEAAGAAERLTLTRAAIARADRIVLLITGGEKRAVLEAALADAASASPVAALFRAPLQTPEILWAA